VQWIRTHQGIFYGVSGLGVLLIAMVASALREDSAREFAQPLTEEQAAVHAASYLEHHLTITDQSMHDFERDLKPWPQPDGHTLLYRWRQIRGQDRCYQVRVDTRSNHRSIESPCYDD